MCNIAHPVSLVYRGLHTDMHDTVSEYTLSDDYSSSAAGSPTLEGLSSRLAAAFPATRNVHQRVQSLHLSPKCPDERNAYNQMDT